VPWSAARAPGRLAPSPPRGCRSRPLGPPAGCPLPPTPPPAPQAFEQFADDLGYAVADEPVDEMFRHSPKYAAAYHKVGRQRALWEWGPREAPARLGR
jgi:hypothetical protein